MADTSVDQFLNRPPLRLPTKLGYGFGSIAYGVAYAGLSGAVLQIYLNQVLGMPALVVGTAIMVSLIADALIDPVIGLASDRLRTAWGRRHPLMYAAAVPAAACFYLLWNAPAHLTGAGLIAFMLTLMIAVRICVSLYEIPSNALTAELTPDYHQRTVLQSYRWLFFLVATATMYMLLNLVFLRTSAHNPLGVLNRAGYARWGMLGAGAMLVSVLISTRATHDQIRYLPKGARARQSLGAALREIRLTLTNPSLLALMLAGLLGGIGGGTRDGLSIYLFTHYWGLDPDQYGVIIPLGLVGSLLAVFMAPPLGRRFGKKPAMMGTFLLSVATGAGPVFLRLIGLMPANGSPWIVPILVVDGVVTLTVAVMGFVLVASMIADVAEDAAVRSGVRSEGLLYAVNGLLPKFTTGIGAFFAGLILTIVHFPAHAAKGTVSPELMRHLVLIYLPISVGMGVASILALGLYRIDKTKHESNLATLRATAEG